MALSSHKYAYGKQGQGLHNLYPCARLSIWHQPALSYSSLQLTPSQHGGQVLCLAKTFKFPALSGFAVCTLVHFSWKCSRQSGLNLNWPAHQPSAGKFPVAPRIRHPVHIWRGDSAHNGGSSLQFNTECCRETAESGRWCTCLCITGIRRGN